MTDDENHIRMLIERWAEAVHAGDLDAVLADHAADIVMFDVPPPYEGVRGIDEYRATWPPFFEWQRQEAVFDPHAFAESKRSFRFLTWVAVGDAEPVAVELEPTGAARTALEELLATCRP